MAHYPDAIKACIAYFNRLPGIGPKSAERIVFYLLKQNPGFIAEFTGTIGSLKKHITVCDSCFNIGATNPCEICADKKRDQRTLCVVADPQDISILEKTGEYRGLYHVLGGVLNPVEGITPDHIRIQELFARIKKHTPRITEVIIATNPDLEGESTALYLGRKLKAAGVRATRLAKGLPMGATIEYADEITITSALKGRQDI
ncbi:MAG: recombination mediator RecR [Patescibacteria group bacterium]|nr:recombination mediator RecR [Patescibacteria group bacterium]MDD5715349.1 recombination mediator RecR [Patescibacteria group bacterium]